MHSTFNPSIMPPAQLEATLVDRNGTVDQVLNLFAKSGVGKAKNGVLLVGPRGIGKSHTVAVIHHRLAEQRSSRKKFAIAYLREDEWGVASLADLLLRIFEALKYEEIDLSKFDINYSDKTPVEAESAIWNLLVTALAGRSLVLIVENLDTIFANIGLAAQSRLKSMMTAASCFWIATSTTLNADLRDERSPFNSFFDVIRLEELSTARAVSLLKRIASYRRDTSMEKFIASPVGRARIRAVQHLAGGNSRIFVLFYDILHKHDSAELIDDRVLEPLQRMIDALTPYYQSKMASLSPLQQKIVLFLSQRRVPVTVASIAKGTFSTSQTISSQLKQLLDDRYVRVNRLGRESYYELAEPLMRICIEAKSHDGLPLRLLVEFLRYWFYREELEKQLSSIDEPGETYHYLKAALKEYDSSDGHQHLTPEIGRLCVALTLAAPNKEAERAEELATVSKIAEDWGHYVHALTNLGRSADAIPDVEKALRKNPNDVETLLALSRAYAWADRVDEALSTYARAIELNPKFSLTWLEQGATLTKLHRYEDAIVSFGTALKLEPKLSDAVRFAKAEAFIRNDEPEKAIKELFPIIETKAEEYGVLAHYGWALLKLGKFKDAITYLNRATKLFPQDRVAMTHLGIGLRQANELERSLKALKRAYEMLPSSKWTAFNYCVSLLDAAKYDKAAEMFPGEIVAHSIMHLLLDIFAKDHKQGSLQIEIEKLERASNDQRWQQAFGGALTEFLGVIAKEDLSTEKIRQLRTWQLASQELYEKRDQYQIYLVVLKSLVDFKSGAGLSSLLVLPLEQRRLIVSETEEQALGRSLMNSPSPSHLM